MSGQFVFRKAFNGAIRHFWFSKWFVWMMNFNEIQKLYDTLRSVNGVQNFIAHLMNLAKNVIHEFHNNRLQEGRTMEMSYSNNEVGLREWCKKATSQWDEQFKLWLGLQEKEQWAQSSNGKDDWKRLNIDPSFRMKRLQIAKEMQIWFMSIS